MSNFTDFISGGSASFPTIFLNKSQTWVPPQDGNIMIHVIGAGGGGLALIAMLEKAWRNNKDELIEEIEDFVEEKTGIDLDLDDAIEEVVDAAIDTAKDIAEDGDLDVSLKDRADDLKDSLKDSPMLYVFTSFLSR